MRRFLLLTNRGPSTPAPAPSPAALSSFSINAAGTTLSLVSDRNVDYDSGVPTLHGTSATVDAAVGGNAGTTSQQFTLFGTVYAGESVTVDVASGVFVNSAIDHTPSATVTGASVDNQSTVPTPPTSTLLNNLVAAWELDEASGTRYDSHDSFDLSQNGTVGSGTGLVHGTAADLERDNGEFLFVAIGGDLQIPDTDSSWTVEMWVKAETVAAGCPVGIGPSTGPILYLSSGVVHAYAGATGMDLAAGSITAGVWSQIIFSNDADIDQWSVEVDGVLTTASSAGGILVATLGDFRIGAYAMGEYFDGLIGPVRFWRRTLTGGERTQLNNGGIGLPYSSF